MKHGHGVWLLAAGALALALAGCSGSGNTPAGPAGAGSGAPAGSIRPAATSAPARPASAASASSASGASASSGSAESAQTAYFTPPAESSIPDNQFGDMVRKGEQIFTHTQKYAGQYVGNKLSCSNCHLNAGRQPDSAPLWAAWVRYPRYRSKNDEVNSYTERLQGCFRFSMNGKVPPADSEVIMALSAYSYWLATGAPTGKDMPGAGFPKQGFSPPKKPDYARGKRVFASHCALCHGDDGQGQEVAGTTVFPSLWGPDSFNWGAGMHQLDNAAAFIKANMPLGRGGMLSDQQAWDVAMYMDSHERPQDPRFTGDVATTRKKYHDNKWSLYGKTVNGHLLGQGTARGSQ
jgi:thiosulfate dehydrogenase